MYAIAKIVGSRLLLFVDEYGNLGNCAVDSNGVVQNIFGNIPSLYQAVWYPRLTSMGYNINSYENIEVYKVGDSISNWSEYILVE